MTTTTAFTSAQNGGLAGISLQAPSTGRHRASTPAVHCDRNTSIPAPWFICWELYQADLQYKGRSPHTIDAHRAALACMARCLVRQGIGDPEQVNRIHMKRYLAEQRPARRNTGFKSLDKDLRVFWAWFAEEHQAANPMEGIERPVIPRAEVPVFTKDELQAIIRAVSGRSPQRLRDSALIWVLLETGLRCSELASLDIGDFDVRNRTLTVRPEAAKGGRPRLVWLGDASFTALMRWLRRRPDGEPLSTSLASNHAGQRLSFEGIGRVLHRIGDEAGVPDVHAHRFRHTLADLALGDGMEATDLAQLLGHSRPVHDLPRVRGLAEAAAGAQGRQPAPAGQHPAPAIALRLAPRACAVAAPARAGVKSLLPRVLPARGWAVQAARYSAIKPV